MGNQQNVVVRMEQKANELADVVVVGYGRQKKKVWSVLSQQWMYLH